jgi:hypothetical protein
LRTKVKNHPDTWWRYGANFDTRPKWRSPTIVENRFSGSEPTIDQAKKLTTGGNWFYPDLFLSLFPIITGVVLYYETAHSTLEHILPGLFC